MGKRNRYDNYDLHPVKIISGYDHHVWDTYESIICELNRAISRRKEKTEKATVVFELYPGVRKDEILRIAQGLETDRIFDVEDCQKPEKLRFREFQDYITDDPVFGAMCHKKVDDLYDREKLQAMRSDLNSFPGTAAVIGFGAGLLSEGDLFIYCDITRWELQLRYRAGMPNWNCTNGNAPMRTKNKIGFFIEWRLADRFKKDRFDRFDYVLETERKNRPGMVTGEAFREGLRTFAREPFRLEPYFDAGVWGGHWMQENFQVEKELPNLAWCFDGVPEENCVNMKFGNVVLKFPAMDITLYCPCQLLGERVYGRFGAEFPIRFDMLDTIGGGNLSLQVHPLTEYIQDTFGMHYTQDESYYLLDTEEDQHPCVYLGLKRNADARAMEEELRQAEKGEIAFAAEKYVNRIPVKPHDHILIPAGTVHCSGKGTMVLEISATPYIFTFKLWDWGRVGMDGVPRPVHVDHGVRNIQWERDTDWVHENLVNHTETVCRQEGCLIERTGLHAREAIETCRYSLEKSCTVECGDSVNVGNLVSGKEARIESPDGSFSSFTVHYAETFIIPASVKRYILVPVNEAIMVMIASVR